MPMGSKNCRHRPRYWRRKSSYSRCSLRRDLVDGDLDQGRGEVDGVVDVGEGGLLLGVPEAPVPSGVKNRSCLRPVCGQELVVVPGELAGFPGSEHGAVRHHVQAGEPLQPAPLLDANSRPHQVADEGVRQEDEAVLVRVLQTEDGAHVLEIERIRERLELALVSVEHAPHARRRVAVDDVLVERRPVRLTSRIGVVKLSISMPWCLLLASVSCLPNFVRAS